MPVRFTVAVTWLATAAVLAQSPQPARLEFEVASIHPSSPAASAGGVRVDGAQVHIAGFPLREYVARAYRVRTSQVIGPDWIASQRFDVDAKLPDRATAGQIPEMLQALLGDRFALKQHREPKEIAVYALTLGKPPLKLKESPRDANAPPPSQAPGNVVVSVGASGVSVDLGNGASYTFGAGRFEGKRMTAAMIAETLERFSERPVVNMTGLAGAYDLLFEVTPEESQIINMRAAVNAGIVLPAQAMSMLDAGGNPLVVAVEQLGLKLDARKVPLDAVIVDDVRRTPIEN
jgi:uncharacterized protein (TIGR03435 family)